MSWLLQGLSRASRPPVSDEELFARLSSCRHAPEQWHEVLGRYAGSMALRHVQSGLESMGLSVDDLAARDAPPDDERAAALQQLADATCALCDLATQRAPQHPDPCWALATIETMGTLRRKWASVAAAAAGGAGAGAAAADAAQEHCVDALDRFLAALPPTILLPPSHDALAQGGGRARADDDDDAFVQSEPLPRARRMLVEAPAEEGAGSVAQGGGGGGGGGYDEEGVLALAPQLRFQRSVLCALHRAARREVPRPTTTLRQALRCAQSLCCT